MHSVLFFAKKTRMNFYCFPGIDKPIFRIRKNRNKESQASRGCSVTFRVIQPYEKENIVVKNSKVEKLQTLSHFTRKTTSKLSY